MPTSYEEAVKEKQRQTEEGSEHLRGFVNYAPEFREEFDGEQLSEVASKVRDILGINPRFIQPGTEGPRGREPITRRPTSPPTLDIDLSELDQRGLLEVIARILIAQTSASFDIADAVEPFRGISVSGTNVIEEDDEAEEVVPGSSGSNIPTRLLMMKASDNNNAPIFIGDDDIEPNNGWKLERGQSLTISTDLREATLYMASEEDGQLIELLGLI